MKKLYLIVMVILFGFQINVLAQEGGMSIGKGDSDADSSAILELVSSNKGLLIPRLSSTERESINSPANGLIVYDTTFSNFYYWNGSKWISISGVNVSSGNSFPVGAKSGDLFFNTSENSLYISISGFWVVAGSKKQVLDLNNTTLKLLEEGKSTGSSVDLSVLLQDLSLEGTKIKISKGNSIDIAPLIKDEQNLSLTGSVISIANGNSIDIAPLIKDEQNLSLKGSVISIANGKSIDIAPLIKDEQNLSLTGSVISIARGNSIDLAPLVKDDQQLSLSGSVISIANGNSIDIAPLIKDEQNLSLKGSVISIANGKSIDIAPLIKDEQNLSLTGSVISIARGNSIDLAPLVKDDQQLSLSGSVLTITNGGSVNFSSLLSASQISLGAIPGMSSANVQDAIAELSLNRGDMLKSEYDADKNGRIDNAEKVNGFTVQSNVPVGAQFTDNQQLYIYGNTLYLTNSTPVTLPTSMSEGDMTKASYDANSNDVVDLAESAQTVSNNSITSAKIADQTIQDTDLAGITLSSVLNGQVLMSNGSGGFSWGTPSSGYTLPTASTSALGGVKVDGSTIVITAGGVISAVGGGGGGGTITAVNGTANQIAASNVSGIVTLSLPTTISGLTAVTATTFTGALAGNATTATTATNIAGGAAGQLLYQSAAGITSKLATGTNGQVLTMASGTPTWAAATGFANPMTTASDIIIGGTAGAASRLAAGTNGQVLTMVSGAPAWTAPSVGGALDATADITGDYAATATDDIILFAGPNQHTLNLPTTGIPVGKLYYVSNSGAGGVTLNPLPREMSAQSLNGGLGGILIYVGSGQYGVLSSF